MGIIVDLIIVLLIFASAFLGYKKGLISLAVHLVAFIITIVVVLIFYKPIGNAIINNTKIDENLQSTIQGNVEKVIATENTDGITNSLIESAKQGMLPEASKTLAINIVYGTTMIVLFIIVRIVLIFVTALANRVAKLPILKQFNKLGGLIYGLLRGVVITYAILMIINAVIAFKPTGTFGTAMNSSHLAKAMLTYNVINVFLVK